ncbi:hypothetical protein V6N13_142573 [Hibiscus sabdariffa]|uniref:Uncharacterized protein n=1 Tax=Hibiscus sabdariffa TaxID=183260 RepID=A0ABR2FEP6_9ROSI
MMARMKHNEKFSAIELRRETELIMQQTVSSQLKLTMRFITDWLQSYLNTVLGESHVGTELNAVEQGHMSSVGSNDPGQGSAR